MLAESRRRARRAERFDRLCRLGHDFARLYYSLFVDKFYHDISQSPLCGCLI